MLLLLRRGNRASKMCNISQQVEREAFSALARPTAKQDGDGQRRYGGARKQQQQEHIKLRGGKFNCPIYISHLLI